MSRDEQREIINAMLRETQARMLQAIEAGKVPVEFDGHELREWYATFVRENFAYLKLDRSRRIAFNKWRTTTPGV